MSLSTPFGAFIFDMDGVIIDSEPLHERATRAASARHGIDVPDGLFDRFRGQTDKALMAHLAQRASDVDAASLLEAKHAAYASLHDELTLLPGVRHFLDILDTQHIPMALVTSAARHDQERTFEQFGLTPYFRTVVTADDVDHAKPHPAPYQQAVRELGLDPSTCWVVEDATHGVESARRAGCRVVGLCSSFSAEALNTAGADVVVDTYPELADRLGIDGG
jgi:HAD superfamily hydrolase (TIGR01509 family)